MATEYLLCFYGNRVSTLFLWQPSIYLVSMATEYLRCFYGNRVSTLFLWRPSIYLVSMATDSRLINLLVMTSVGIKVLGETDSDADRDQIGQFFDQGWFAIRLLR